MAMALGQCGWFGKDVIQDVTGRLPYYWDDWRLATTYKLRLLAPATYIFIASVLPALAFGEQLSQSTDGTLTVVHVLASTAIAGVIQALVGGQPLLIIGVAEPIVIIYTFMYRFAQDREELAGLFLPWAAWVCVWVAIMIALIAMSGGCRFISRFTRCMGELFGMLIAVLFMEEAVKGLIGEFRGIGVENPDLMSSSWILVNGLWSLILAIGMLASSLVLVQARGTRIANGVVRGLVADYGVLLMLVAWSGLSFALASAGNGPGVPPGLPRRVNTPNTWQVKESWHVANRMSDVPGVAIAYALVPALAISVLFWFDHGVSAQMAQSEDFEFEKPPAYAYDMLLLAAMTLTCGLLGIPPVNGVLPQAPMHTRALAGMRAQAEEAWQKQQKLQDPPDPPKAEDCSDTLTPEASIPLSKPRVAEQRITNLVQSLLVAVCLGLTPVIRQLPTGVVWGFFAYMSLDSLPGSQFFQRLALLTLEPKDEALHDVHHPYLESVPLRVVHAFTIFQFAWLAGVWGLIEFAGIAGVAFPVAIVLLIPVRMYILPRVMKPEHLAALDPDVVAAEEVLPPVDDELEQRDIEAMHHGVQMTRASRTSTGSMQRPSLISGRGSRDRMG